MYKTILFIIFILLFLYWFYYALRSYNPYKFHLSTGKKGAGKSSIEALDTVKFSKSKHLIYDENEKPFHRFKKIKFNIYSNSPINYVDCELFNPLELGVSFFPKPYSLLLIDEISLFWWNRNFKSMNEKTIEWFRNQRKHKCIVYGYTQSWDIDKVLRKSLVDYVYHIKNFMITFAVVRKIDKYQQIKDSALDCDSQFSESMDYVPFWVPGAIRIIWLPNAWKYFDTNYIFKKE